MCPEGVAVLVELKRPGKAPSKIQGHFLGVFERLGFRACKIDAISEFHWLLTVSTQRGKLRSVARGAPKRRTE